ncbi:hypothetical protein BJ508DRAFT_364116 [Ascobolus immersus RN42]|uniref:Uncharacterized protein n=1 Tax=Ascobolus immersus RN42 TaxID=1160509 RepID=A0A3N4HXW3_ASCIM|nr:hypothetical protein BJ508DRAFT_364116 [Ascobolus immersus RN42]
MAHPDPSRALDTSEPPVVETDEASGEARIRTVEEALGMYREYSLLCIEALKKHGHWPTPSAGVKFNPERCKAELTAFVARTEEIYHAIQYFRRARLEGEREGYHPSWDRQKRTVKNEGEVDWGVRGREGILKQLEEIAENARAGNTAAAAGGKLKRGESKTDRKGLRGTLRRRVKNLFFDPPPEPLVKTVVRPAAENRYSLMPDAVVPSRVKGLRISRPVMITPMPGGGRLVPAGAGRRGALGRGLSVKSDGDIAETGRRSGGLVGAFESLEVGRSPKLRMGVRSLTGETTRPEVRRNTFSDGSGRLVELDGGVPGLQRSGSKFVPPRDEDEDPYRHLRREPKTRTQKRVEKGGGPVMAPPVLRSGVASPPRVPHDRIASPTRDPRDGAISPTYSRPGTSLEPSNPFDDPRMSIDDAAVQEVLSDYYDDDEAERRQEREDEALARRLQEEERVEKERALRARGEDPLADYLEGRTDWTRTVSLTSAAAPPPSNRHSTPSTSSIPSTAKNRLSTASDIVHAGTSFPSSAQDPMRYTGEKIKKPMPVPKKERGSTGSGRSVEARQWNGADRAPPPTVAKGLGPGEVVQPVQAAAPLVQVRRHSSRERRSGGGGGRMDEGKRYSAGAQPLETPGSIIHTLSDKEQNLEQELRLVRQHKEEFIREQEARKREEGKRKFDAWMHNRDAGPAVWKPDPKALPEDMRLTYERTGELRYRHQIPQESTSRSGLNRTQTAPAETSMGHMGMERGGVNPRGPVDYEHLDKSHSDLNEEKRRREVPRQGQPSSSRPGNGALGRTETMPMPMPGQFPPQQQYQQRQHGRAGSEQPRQVQFSDADPEIIRSRTHQRSGSHQIQGHSRQPSASTAQQPQYRDDRQRSDRTRGSTSTKGSRDHAPNLDKSLPPPPREPEPERRLMEDHMATWAEARPLIRRTQPDHPRNPQGPTYPRLGTEEQPPHQPTRPHQPRLQTHDNRPPQPQPTRPHDERDYDYRLDSKSPLGHYADAYDPSDTDSVDSVGFNTNFSDFPRNIHSRGPGPSHSEEVSPKTLGTSPAPYQTLDPDAARNEVQVKPWGKEVPTPIATEFTQQARGYMPTSPAGRSQSNGPTTARPFASPTLPAKNPNRQKSKAERAAEIASSSRSFARASPARASPPPPLTNTGLFSKNSTTPQSSPRKQHHQPSTSSPLAHTRPNRPVRAGDMTIDTTYAQAHTKFGLSTPPGSSDISGLDSSLDFQLPRSSPQPRLPPTPAASGTDVPAGRRKASTPGYAEAVYADPLTSSAPPQDIAPSPPHSTPPPSSPSTLPSVHRG